ncbi:MAG: hypothetical protein QW057_02565 [Candidatus Bathyarchaeia archaeon]
MAAFGGKPRAGRDWRSYDAFRKSEEALFLERVKAVVWGLPPPMGEG